METLTQFGSYQIVRKIGAGGMADVYEAVRVGLENFQTRVALKCIQPSMTRDERFVKMFINEAQLGSQLHHPNIIQVQDFNKFEDTYYIAMEYVEGVDLSRIIKRLAARGLGFPATVVIDLALQALAGLGHAHEARRSDGSPMNIIHRDVKPSNFLITPSGMVKVGDFGIAKMANSTHNLSLTGDSLKGTINYMSPEQIDGATLTPASDLFGVTAIIFEMLTLRALFDGPTMSSILLKIAMVNIESDMQLVNSRYPIFIPVLRKGLAREHKDRYQTASAISAALRRLREELGDGLSLREFLAMHLELFAPYGTQPGEQEDQDEALSMALTPPNGVRRQPLSMEIGIDPSDFDRLGGNTDSGIPFERHELTPPLALSDMGNYPELGSSSGSLKVMTPAPGASPAWNEDLGSVAQALLPHDEPEEPTPVTALAPLQPPAPVYVPPVVEPLPAPAPASRGRLYAAVIAVAVVVGAVLSFVLPQKSTEGVSTAAQLTAVPAESNTGVTAAPVNNGPAPAQVAVETTPSGARIWIDGKDVGVLTPSNVPLPLDKAAAEIKLELPGYQPFTRTINYQSGQVLSLNSALVPLPVKLLITSDPPGARIFIDQKSTGKVTPFTFEGLSPAAPLRIALRMNGFEPSIEDLKLTPNQANTYAVTLVKEQEKSTANDKPEKTPRPERPAEPVRPTTTQPDPPRVTEPPPKPVAGAPAALVLNTVPDDAEVYVNDVRKGPVPQTIRLSAGTVGVEFRAFSSGKRKEVSVTLTPGEEKRVIWFIDEDNLKIRSGKIAD